MSFPSYGFGPDELVLRHVFEQSAVGLFQSSMEGRNLLSNPAFAFLLGYESPEQLRESLTDVARQFYVDTGRRAEIAQMIARGGGHVEDCESQVWRRDGTKIWIAECTRIVIDPLTSQTVYLGSVTDVTAHRRSEQALLESEDRLRRELEKRRQAERALQCSVQEALLVCDAEGGVAFCSQRAARLLQLHFGTRPSDPLPLDLSTLLLDGRPKPGEPTPLQTPAGLLIVKAAPVVAEEGFRAFHLEEPLRPQLLRCMRARGLTEREAEVLFWIANAKTNSEIATLLQVAEKTVKKHLERIYQKLGVENRTAALLRTTQWLQDPEGALVLPPA